MKYKYNLIDQHWIPCIDQCGELDYYGLEQLITKAHLLTAIRDDSPLVTISLYRLVLAVLHRVYSTETPSVWAKLWSDGNGTFDPVPLRKYFEQDHVRRGFDLFDEQYPFYQTASLPLGPVDRRTNTHKYVKPITQLCHEITYSDSMNLFCHESDLIESQTTPAYAAKSLITFHNFALGGLIACLESEKRSTEGSADAGQLVKSAITLIQGRTLFQTLALNMVGYNSEDDKPFRFKQNEDEPAWEVNHETKPKDRQYKGYLDLLTWQSRRVKLVVDPNSTIENPRVIGVVTMKGYQLPDSYTRLSRETMTCFTKAERVQSGDGWLPLGFRESRSLWRDSASLFQSITDSVARPLNLQNLDELNQLGFIEQTAFDLAVFGVCVDRAKIFLWRHEEFPLPLEYLSNSSLHSKLLLALDMAEKAAREALRPAAWATATNRLSASADSSPDKNRVSQLVDAMAPERFYWSRLELPFREFLVALAEADDASRSGLLTDWFHHVVRKQAIEAFNRCVETIDAGRDLKAINAGRAVLYARLKQIQSDNSINARQKAGVA